VRIVAWNIRAGGGVRSGGLADQLVRWRADVVLLSEFRATPPSRALARALAERGLRHQRTTAEDDAPSTNGLLLAARWPLRVRAVAAPDPRRWLLARVAPPASFWLAGMHVPSHASGRKYPFHETVLRVARGWSHGAAILVGDTNSGLPGIDEEVPVFGPREAHFLRALEASGFRDAFRAAHGERRAYTWYSPNGGNGFRLDQAFVEPELLGRVLGVRHAWGRPRSGRSHREALSDHAALIVDLADSAPR
jgi:exonuclease III